MTTLLISNLVLFAVSFLAAMMLTKELSARYKMSLAATILALTLPSISYTLYYLHLFDNWAWFYQVRSYEIFNYYPGTLGLAAGALFPLLSPRYRKIGLILITLAFVVIPFSKQLISPLDISSLKNIWQDGVCIQSSASSCAPACTSTLLNEVFKDKVNENLVASKAFTCSTGTEAWYLAQYLKRKDYDVSFITKQQSPIVPSIAGTRSGGVGHFIVILSQTSSYLEIADPLNGKRREINVASLHLTGFFMIITKAT
jgi:hypothetical protein